MPIHVETSSPEHDDDSPRWASPVQTPGGITTKGSNTPGAKAKAKQKAHGEQVQTHGSGSSQLTAHGGEPGKLHLSGGLSGTHTPRTAEANALAQAMRILAEKAHPTTKKAKSAAKRTSQKHQNTTVSQDGHESQEKPRRGRPPKGARAEGVDIGDNSALSKEPEKVVQLVMGQQAHTIQT
jgi:hypothetical protein